MKTIASRLLAAILLVCTSVSAALAQNEVVINSGFVAPTFVAADSSGNLFVSDTTGTMGAFLYEVPLVDGSYAATPVPLATGKLPYAYGEGIAVDQSGNLYVGFTNGATGGVVEVMAPGYTEVNTLYSASGVAPFGVAIDPAGDVFYVDGSSGAVVELPAGTPSTPQTIYFILGGYQAVGLAIDSQNNLFVDASTYGPFSSPRSYVQELVAANGYISGGPQIGRGTFYYGGGLAIDASDNLYVVDIYYNQVTKFAAPDYGAWTIVDNSAYRSLNGIAVDQRGDLFISKDGPTPALLEIPLVPRVTSISPNSGVTTGGGTVTINGQNLDGATAVYFGSTSATAVVAMNGSQVSAVAPPESAGTVDVTVVTPLGTSAVVPGDQYTYVNAPPAVQLVTPSGGSIAGGTNVTIAGASFTGATSIEFGTVAAISFTIDSDLQITAVAPAEAAGTVDVTVVTPTGTSPVFHSLTNNGDQFTYSAPPTASYITPAGGPVGTPVAIIGTGFVSAPGITQVLFGTTPAPGFTVDSDTHISAVVPPVSGTVDVTIVTPAGTTATTGLMQYTVEAQPILSGLSPASGPLAGGTSLTITGSGFSGVGAVMFGSLPAAGFTVNSDTQITAVSPFGMGAGPVDVVVSSLAGLSATSPADQFTYVADYPTISSLSPSSGPLAGGSSVVITGTDFAGANMVTFGSVPAASFQVSSPTQIIAVSPAGGAAGAVDVMVATPNGVSVGSPADQFTYIAAPTVTALSPSSGPLAGGSSVTIAGTGLTGASTVTFGAVPAASFRVVSATQITAVSPAGSAAGSVDITVATPNGTSATGAADRFTYIAAPTVTALSPSSGPLAGGSSVVITGTGLTGASTVTFGAVPAASFQVASATQITAVSPAGSAAGSVDVTVATPNGTSATGAANRFTYIGQAAVAVTSSANPSSFGQAVTFTASVDGASGGTAIFRDGATILSTGTLANGRSSYTTAALAPGSHAITVTYSGGSGELIQQVSGAATTPDQAYSYQSTLGVPGVAAPDDSHFNTPAVGAVDSVNGHLLIADTGGHRIQVLDTGTLALVATIGTAGVPGSDNAHFDGPEGVGFDAGSDRIFVADSGNDRVQLFDAKSFAYLTTLDTASFSAPGGVQGSSTGHVFVADTGNQRVQIFDGATLANLGTLGSTGVAGSDNAHFNAPMDAVLNPTANEILVADSGNGRVQRFDATTLAYKGTIGGADLNIASNAYLGRPVSVAFDPVSNLVLVADDSADQRVQVFDALSYNYVLTLGTTGSAGAGNGQFSGPAGVAVDATHALLFIGDRQNDRVQAFAIATPSLFASVLPGSRSVRLGTPATLFASLVNAGTTALQGCQAVLPVTAPAGLTLSYQATDASTNALTGTPDTPVAIAGQDGVQSFLLTFSSTQAMTASDMAVDFDCLGSGPAAVTAGVDTVDLTVSATSTADIVALAATLTGDGIAVIPASGTGAFAVASANVGATAELIVSVDTGSASLPLSATLCQSNPSTGACLATPSAAVTLSDTAGATPTFSVFLQATGPIPFAPARSRVFVRFKDSAGGLHGSTSVAVETE